MIKSPCKDCQLYEQDFPTCFETCDLLKEVQLYNIEQPNPTFNSFSFVPGENYTFTKITSRLPAMS